ncbi:MAG TPA: hypothetical protein VFX50_09070, partial [Gemmatimonadales bacterium]|nr:hypothetical protein [Gemmatimonadales bacterium]
MVCERVVIGVLALAVGVAAVAMVDQGRRWAASAQRLEAARAQRQAAEAGIRGRCGFAYGGTIETERQLERAPVVGLGLALKDAASARLCGGDERA